MSTQKKIMKNKTVSIVISAILSILLAVGNTYIKHVFPDWLALTIYVAIPVVLALSIVFCVLDKEILFKLFFIVLAIGAAFILIICILNASGIIEKMMKDGTLSVDAIKDYILSLGDLGLIVFLLLQIAQVTLIPIPSNIVTIAGVGIFGIWPAFFISTIGQIIGSIIAFGLGKFFGVKLVVWIVGEEMLTKYQEMIKGRDKLMLTVMFILPVFPDDILCLIAGLSSMSWLYFIIVMLIARPLTCLGNAVLADGALSIPFEGWGILAWVAIVGAVIALMILILKYGDKFQEFVVRKFRKTEKED